eukprot:COSAG01_NODE_1972_length_8757_cov_109.482559_4_plen_351_part_00
MQARDERTETRKRVFSQPAGVPSSSVSWRSSSSRRSGRSGIEAWRADNGEEGSHPPHGLPIRSGGARAADSSGRYVRHRVAMPGGTAASGAHHTAPAAPAARTIAQAKAAARAEAREGEGGQPLACVHTPVHHIQQAFKWDCGLACVLMALRANGIHKTRQDLVKMAETTSIWTVDLAYIMRRCGLAFSFYTVMEGVRDSYSEEVFYAQDLDVDRQRVTRLFREAHSAGVDIRTSSMSSSQLAEALFEAQLAIVLTDRRLLRPQKRALALAKRTEQVIDFQSVAVDGSSFTGHYVVVAGFDRTTSTFDVVDPACSVPRYTVPAEQLDRARTAFGTDEDLLLVQVCSTEGR